MASKDASVFQKLDSTSMNWVAHLRRRGIPSCPLGRLADVVAIRLASILLLLDYGTPRLWSQRRVHCQDSAEDP
ncbi:hypothetical protein AVEN_43297-1 [Araneus ventricosus]|uniref:Uncharacterized protein n=1 Tax=Araneus ventricosus TaxID=182803 RepID=A0A4Y2GE74_ARAVE|nr:hypothetical protein AVEN_43297-1 [Araneus ventricosus]